MATGTADAFWRRHQPDKESEGIPVDRNQLLTELLITARDAIEDALDELNPPPAEERLERELSEAPPNGGVALPGRRDRRGSYTAKVQR